MPDVTLAAINCERFGAEGVTVHPRPDGRHIRYEDVYSISGKIKVEFNIEGYPSDDFLKMVKEVKPAQVTFVPDPPDALTSNAGWDTKKHLDFLQKIIKDVQKAGIRTSIFVDTEPVNMEYAAKTGTDRIELYTEPYAANFHSGKEKAIAPFIKSAELANKLGLGINAGHDLNLDNLKYFAENIPGLLEVSIGHALISDALYYGLENTIQMYLKQLRNENP
jgi:pyridoxine 5-phosphate synthase